MKPQSASKILSIVTKKTGIYRGANKLYNENTLRERKASTHKLTLEASVMNSEWDNLTPKALMKLLHLRFRSNLEVIFGDLDG